MYIPVIFFRAKCFAKTPIHVIFGKHYEASWKDKVYKRECNAFRFAREQIYYDPDVWQLPGTKRID